MVKVLSQSVLWSKVCHIQCYSQKYVLYVTVSAMVKSMYVTVNVMVKGMSQSVLWSKVCHIQCHAQKYVTFNGMVKSMYCMSQCYGQKYVCHS